MLEQCGPRCASYGKVIAEDGPGRTNYGHVTAESCLGRANYGRVTVEGGPERRTYGKITAGVETDRVNAVVRRAHAHCSVDFHYIRIPSNHAL